MSLVISTQAQLTASLGLTIVNSNVDITDLLSTDPITTLEWPNLTVINGSLNLTLQSLATLDAAFPNLVSVVDIFIFGCVELTEIKETAFPKITSLERLFFINNAKLEKISSFQALVSADNLQIEENPVLTNISGLCALELVRNFLFISENALLQNVDPLCHLNNVGNNFNIEILDNAKLVRYCGLVPLASKTVDDQWKISGNALNPARENIENTDPCVVEDFVVPPDVALLCGDKRTTEPKDTGEATANYAKEITYEDSFPTTTNPCAIVIDRRWTATSFCGVSESKLQVILDLRPCPLSINCPNDFYVTCETPNLCPENTGGFPEVFETVSPLDYKLDYLDFVSKRSLKTCKPLIIKRRWSATSDCPSENSVVYCVQTIYVPCDWPFFETCGFTPTKFSKSCGKG